MAPRAGPGAPSRGPGAGSAAIDPESAGDSPVTRAGPAPESLPGPAAESASIYSDFKLPQWPRGPARGSRPGFSSPRARPAAAGAANLNLTRDSPGRRPPGSDCHAGVPGLSRLAGSS